MAVGMICAVSGQTAERDYSVHLNEKNSDHEESVDIVCPADSINRYENGLATCSVHEESSENDQDEEPREEVPWLCYCN